MNNYMTIFSFALLLSLCPAANAETLEELLVRKGIISQSEAAQSSSGRVSYDKGLKVDFPDKGNGVKLFSLIQPRYQFTDQDAESGKNNSSSFQMKRARIYASGYALQKEFTFALMTDLVGSTSSEGAMSPDLQDAIVEYHPSPSWDVRMGQFLVPFVRESLQAYTQQFPEFSVATTNFALFRQPGAGAWYRSEDNKFTLGASMYNGNSTGEGRNRPAVDTKHTAVVNGRWSPLAPINILEEGDIGSTQDPAVSMGAAYLYAQANIDKEGILEDSKINGYNADLNFKYMGFSAHGEIMGYSRTGEVGKSSPIGMYAQLGYFLVPKTFEVAGRYSTVDCDKGGGSQCGADIERVNEAAVSGNYFFSQDHTLKAQLAWIWRRDEKKESQDIDTSKIILQLSALM